MIEIRPTRRLIRSKATGLWLDTDGQWTTEIDQARNFDGIVDAMHAVDLNSLKGVQFVIRFGYSSEPDLVVDLPDSRD